MCGHGIDIFLKYSKSLLNMLEMFNHVNSSKQRCVIGRRDLE